MDEGQPQQMDVRHGLENRKEEADVAHRGQREEGDVNGEVEKDGPTGDESPEVPQPAQHVELTATGERIRRGELGVGKSDADINQSSEEKGNVGSALRRGQDQPESDVDVGANVGVSPGERSPGTNRPAQPVLRLARGSARLDLEPRRGRGAHQLAPDSSPSTVARATPAYPLAVRQAASQERGLPLELTSA